MSELRCQDRYWRQYTECICGQEDYVLSCRCRRNRANDFFDVVDRVGNTSVFCYALISEIDLTVCINCYVLKKSVTFDCIVDVRLRFFVKVDNLSVASAFKVEYTVVIPAVFVITDQETFRVCGKSCFTCSGKSEEDSCVFTVHICVSGAVHSCDAFQWKEVVHHREHTFLHFSAVPCVDDNLLFGCNVEHYSCFRVQAEFFVVCQLLLWKHCIQRNPAQMFPVLQLLAG